MAKFQDPVAQLTEEELKIVIQWGALLREEAEAQKDNILWDENDSRIHHSLNSKLKEMRGPTVSIES